MGLDCQLVRITIGVDYDKNTIANAGRDLIGDSFRAGRAIDRDHAAQQRDGLPDPVDRRQCKVLMLDR